MNNPNQPQPKKVFDVMRPGKALASPTSRPVITGHKPKVKDDMFVPSNGSRLAGGSPFDEHSLMEHDSQKKFASQDVPAQKIGKQLTPAEQGSMPETGVDTAAPAISQETLAEESPKLPANFPEEPDEDVPSSPSEMDKPANVPAEGHNEDIALIPDEPQAPAPDDTKSEQTDKNLGGIQSDFASGQPAGRQQSGRPADAPSSPLPSAPADKPGGTMTHDDVIAATGAPILDHAIVSHHKVKSKWWEWLLLFLLILLVALAALNFLLDAEVITIDLDVPHTELIN
ncbi:MAG TPA: hypothetical protein VFT16_02580 [Candidatus Saccharimonadales bacterium]|nr:hypothetical protein [Candidatus Saccharimonadales bacterium]